MSEQRLLKQSGRLWLADNHHGNHGQPKVFHGFSLPRVQPWVNGPERFHKATIVSSHATAAAGFAELERIARRLSHFGLPGNAIELFVVDERRRQLTVDG
jgi:hypothetical protein